MTDDLRGTDRTTRQIQAAPHDAIYVVASSGEAKYVRALADHLDRRDLVVRQALDARSRLLGRRDQPVVIDHYVHEYPKLSRRELELLWATSWIVDPGVIEGTRHD